MRIIPGDTLVGYPVLQIRRLLNEARLGGCNAALTEHVLGVDSTEAEVVIAKLEQLGYLERSSYRDTTYWQTTLQGNAFSLASAAKPIKRRTADRKLKEFLQRVEHVRDNDQYMAKVTKVILFGSYLSDREEINDIDLAVTLAWKDFGDRDFMEAVNEHVAAAQKEGRSFRTHYEMVNWPRKKVWLYLKARSRSLSFHDEGDGILEQCEKKVIYKEAG